MELFLFLGAVLVLCLAPGPNVFMTLSFALSHGFGAGARAVLGTAAASVIFLTVSALGLIAVLVASSGAFALLRIAGAAYLIVLGGRLWLAARRVRDGAEVARVRAGAHAFAQGFVTHLSNPKVLLYWTAMLPQFMDATRPPAAQVALLGASGTLIHVVVLLGYAALGARTRNVLETPGLTKTLDVVAGTFFVVTGAWLLDAALA